MMGRTKIEEVYTAFGTRQVFVLCEHDAFLQTSIPNLAITGLCFDRHLNKTLGISELCLRLAFGLRSDQEG